jgi:hypothetical protein
MAVMAVSTKSLAALGSHDLAQAFKVLPRFARLRYNFSELLHGSRDITLIPICSAQVSSSARENHTRLLTTYIVSGEVPQQPVASRKSG